MTTAANRPLSAPTATVPGRAALSRRALPAAISTRAAVALSIALHAASGTAWFALGAEPREARAEAAARNTREIRLVWTAVPAPLPSKTRDDAPLLEPPAELDVEPVVDDEGLLTEPAMFEDTGSPNAFEVAASDSRRLAVVTAASVTRLRSESPPAVEIEPRPDEIPTADEPPAPIEPTPPDPEEPMGETPVAPQVSVVAPVPAPDNPAVVYPGVARRRGYEGRVVLLVSVDATGRALGVTVADSSGHDVLDRAARNAVSGWRFHPATEDGAAIAGEAEVSIRFQLRDR